MLLWKLVPQLPPGCLAHNWTVPREERIASRCLTSVPRIQHFPAPCRCCTHRAAPTSCQALHLHQRLQRRQLLAWGLLHSPSPLKAPALLVMPALTLHHDCHRLRQLQLSEQASALCELSVERSVAPEAWAPGEGSHVNTLTIFEACKDKIASIDWST